MKEEKISMVENTKTPEVKPLTLESDDFLRHFIMILGRYLRLLHRRSVMSFDTRALLRTESEGFGEQTLTILPPSRTVRPRGKENTCRHGHVRLDYSSHEAFRAWGKPNLCQV